MFIIKEPGLVGVKDRYNGWKRLKMMKFINLKDIQSYQKCHNLVISEMLFIVKMRFVFIYPFISPLCIFIHANQKLKKILLVSC